MAKHHVGRSSEWHVLADDKGMCFANGLLVYLSVNKRLSCTGSRILVFEIDHRRPNPRSTFWIAQAALSEKASCLPSHSVQRFPRPSLFQTEAKCFAISYLLDWLSACFYV
jgi:hypothetical protein